MVSKFQQAGSAPLDASAIVAFFGGADELARAFEKHAIVELTPFAIRQWVTRRHIPFRRRLDLKTLAGKQKRTFKLEKFKPKEAPAPKPAPKPAAKAKRRKKVA